MKSTLKNRLMAQTGQGAVRPRLQVAARLMALQHQMLEQASSWWDALSREHQEDYVKEHPNSIYADKLKALQNDKSVQNDQKPQPPGTQPAPMPPSPEHTDGDKVPPPNAEDPKATPSAGPTAPEVPKADGTGAPPPVTQVTPNDGSPQPAADPNAVPNPDPNPAPPPPPPGGLTQRLMARIGTKLAKMNPKDQAFFKNGGTEPNSAPRSKLATFVRARSKELVHHLFQDAKEYGHAVNSLKKMCAGQQLHDHEKAAIKTVAQNLAVVAGSMALTGGLAHGLVITVQHLAVHLLHEAALKAAAKSVLHASTPEMLLAAEKDDSTEDKGDDEGTAPPAGTAPSDGGDAPTSGDDAATAPASNQPAQDVTSIEDTADQGDAPDDDDPNDAEGQEDGAEAVDDSSQKPPFGKDSPASAPAPAADPNAPAPATPPVNSPVGTDPEGVPVPAGGDATDGDTTGDQVQDPTQTPAPGDPAANGAPGGDGMTTPTNTDPVPSTDMGADTSQDSPPGSDPTSTIDDNSAPPTDTDPAAGNGLETDPATMPIDGSDPTQGVPELPPLPGKTAEDLPPPAPATVPSVPMPVPQSVPAPAVMPTGQPMAPAAPLPGQTPAPAVPTLAPSGDPGAMQQPALPAQQVPVQMVPQPIPQPMPVPAQPPTAPVQPVVPGTPGTPAAGPAAAQPLPGAPAGMVPPVPAAPVDPSQAPQIPDPVAPVGGQSMPGGGAAVGPDQQVDPTYDSELDQSQGIGDPNAAVKLGQTGDQDFMSSVIDSYADVLQRGNFPEEAWAKTADDLAAQGEQDDQRISASAKRIKGTAFARLVEAGLFGAVPQRKPRK